MIIITCLMTGWIFLNDENDKICSNALETLKKTGLATGVVELKSGKDVTERWEMLDGPMEGSVGYFNPSSVYFPAVKVDTRAGQMPLKRHSVLLLKLNASGRYST
jgi:hypothetical protein